jgi:hypothetical protein
MAQVQNGKERNERVENRNSGTETGALQRQPNAIRVTLVEALRQRGCGLQNP